MDIAIDKITGAKVKADVAKTYKTYKCPECAAPVFLVDATLRARHFSHYANTAKGGCPLYHEGSDSSGVFKRKAFRHREPRLALQTYSEHGQLRWQLKFVVPKIEEFSSFTLSQSPNIGRISMLAVDQKGREFPVFPSATGYLLKLFAPETGSDVVSVDGLGESCLFRLSAGLGSRVEPMEQLVSGNAYVVVRKQPLSNVPTEVQIRPLHSVDEWNACILRFRPIISNPVRSWIAKTLGFQIRDIEATAAIIWPAVAEHGLDGHWFIPGKVSEPTIVAVQLDGIFSQTATLVHEDGRKPSELKLAESRSFLQLEKLPLGYHELRFEDADIAPVRIIADLMTRKSRCEAVTFEILENGESRNEQLWSSTLIHSFEVIRAGRAALRGVSLPSSCKIEWRTSKGENESAKMIEGGSSGSEILFRELNLSLRTGSATFEINAGGFGYVCFPIPQERLYAKSEVAPNKTVPDTNRLRWLTLAGFDRRARESFAKEEIDGLDAHARQAGLLS